MAIFKEDASTRIVVSHPKSGRTWLHFALNEYGIKAHFTHARSSVGVKSRGYMGREIPEALKEHPIVFLHRNPIDTAVSYYYQTTKRVMPIGSLRWLKKFPVLAFKGLLPPRDIDEFVLHPAYGVQKICAYNRKWLDHVSNREGCLVLKYDDLRQDSATGFQTLLDHWGITSVSGDQLAAASTVEKMRAVESRGQHLTNLSKNKKPPNTREHAKVRRAIVNGFTDELRPETVQRCSEIAADFGFLT